MTVCIFDECESTDLVYSGVDAFVLGVPTEKVCYPHARTYTDWSNE